MAIASARLNWQAALAERPADGWLVLVTDRSDDDLGAGLLAHLVGQRKLVYELVAELRSAGVVKARAKAKFMPKRTSPMQST